MHVRTLVAGLLLGALALTVAAQDPEPKTKAKKYKTPQAVFDAFWGAAKKKDFKTAIDCLTPEALNITVGRIAQDTLEMRERGGVPRFAKDKAGNDEQTKKNLKIISDVLDKHGLTQKVAKELLKAMNNGGNDRKKVLADLLKHIKKPEVFAHDMINAMMKVNPERIGAPPDRGMKLADLKVDGDKATGNIVEMFQFKDKDKPGRKEFKRPVEFLRIKGGWRINPSPERGRDVPKKDGVKDVKKDTKDK